MKNLIVVTCALAALVVVTAAYSADGMKDPGKEKQVKRGEHLVKIGLCGDCHTPKKMGPNGPEEDMSRMLSGHPASPALPPAPKLPPGPWMIAGDGGLTAWTGPWGVSFTRNLTPDKETGLGDWTEQNFLDTIRTGKKLGKGRAILPPMPIPGMNNYTDDELKAMFAYLRTIPAIKNPVPEPIPPAPRPAAPAPGKP
jgi:mono/diheme cytochrome c family protein